jgi:hypothetical protein
MLTVTSDFTVDGALACFKDIIIKRHEFFRNLSIFINIIAKFYDKVFFYKYACLTLIS